MIGLENCHVVLGVSGGIAAYKAAELCRLLQKRGAAVQVIMTRSATEFVSPLTFATLSQHPVCTSLFDSNENWEMDHIQHARWGDILVVAPATANVIGKFASGVADDALSTLYLAWDKPVLVAPAMNPKMWGHTAVTENMVRLVERGVNVVGPDAGEVACGDEGPGRMSEPADIMMSVEQLMGGKRSLAGRKVLITAGPTREYIDPVRFISNPSSGKMGVALAMEASARGAEVTLVAGPMGLSLNNSVKRVDVVSAAEMHETVTQRWQEQDIIIFAAAVSDYAPVKKSEQKIKKSSDGESLELRRTSDIAREVGEKARGDSRKRVLVGFAAESEDVEEQAAEKLKAKKLDLIVANDVGQPGGVFGEDENAAMLLRGDGQPVRLERQSKRKLAADIFEEIERLL